MTLADGSAPAWYETFAPFGLTHLLVVLVSAGLVVWACRRGRRRFGEASERRFCRKWVFFIVCTQLVHTGYWLAPEQFHVTNSLPLHLCDVVVWIAAAALTWERRWLRALLYFWAIGLSTQAFVTPTTRAGIAEPHFWFFWVTHLQIVGSAVYDAAVRGYRPSGRDYLIVTIANFAYLAMITPVNLTLGTNYGYVGESTPTGTTVIDLLGPWPLRLVWMALIVQSGMLALWLVWPVAHWLRMRERPDA